MATMNIYLKTFFKLLPALTFLFTVLVLYVLVYIDNDASNWFIIIFVLAEMYVNWIAIHISSVQIFTEESKRKDKTDKNNILIDVYRETATSSTHTSFNNTINSNMLSASNIDIKQIWFCSKCLTNTPIQCRHCPLCDKCIMYRDHHCFFLGVCICKQNLGHFIIMCIYVSLACMYVDFCLFPYLFRQTTHEEGNITFWYLIAQCFFPITLSKWSMGQVSLSFLFLVSLFDILISTGILTFSFGMYHLFLALTGCHASLGNFNKFDTKKLNIQNLRSNFGNLFGKWGVMNFLFPVVLGRKLLQLYNSNTNYKLN